MTRTYSEFIGTSLTSNTSNTTVLTLVSDVKTMAAIDENISAYRPCKPNTHSVVRRHGMVLYRLLPHEAEACCVQLPGVTRDSRFAS